MGRTKKLPASSPRVPFDALTGSLTRPTRCRAVYTALVQGFAENALVIDDSGQDLYTRGITEIAPKPNQTVTFRAPVYLPQGATITRVVAIGTDFADGDNSLFGFLLNRIVITPTTPGNPFPSADTLAGQASGGLGGSDVDAVVEIEATNIDVCDPIDPLCAVVDNTQYSYTLEVTLHTNPNPVFVYGAYIEYRGVP